MEVVFRLVARGEGIRPDSITLTELVDVLSKVERGVRALIAEPLVSGEHIELSLVDIEAGSTVLAFAASHPSKVSQAVNAFNEQLVAQRVEALPKPTRELVSVLEGMAGRRSASVALVPQSRQYDEVPWISAGYAHVPSMALVYGETVLEGLLVRVGGMVPKIGIMVDSRLLPCNASVDLVKQAGPLVYQQVVLEGQATWDASTWSLVAFTPHAILDYSPGPQQEALAELARLAGPDAWSDWDDVQSVVSELRKE